MIPTAKSRYLNADRREDVYWVGALQGYLEGKTKYYDGEALKWLNSTLLSLECFLRSVLEGIEPKEKRAIENMIQDLTPVIQVDKLAREGPQFVTVDADTLYDFAEYSMEYCKHCEGNYDTCRLRELALKVGIPPYVEIGPCQYFRGEEGQKMKYEIHRTDGKDISGNTYLVVNTDEPYAGEVADVIEIHERARGTWEHGDKSLREVMNIKED